MLASTMCIPSPALAQESRSDNSPTSELQEPSNEETLGDKLDSTLAAANDSPSLQATEAAVEDAPIALSAGEDAESTLTYSIGEDGNATITGTTDEKTKRGIVIPESIDGHPVTAIAAYAFSGKTPQSDYDLSDRTDLWLTSIYIPNSVKSIGGFAFSNNKNLESVHLPENGCTIGHRDNWDAYGSIFDECVSLKLITIPKGLNIIDGSYRGTYISALSAPKLESVTFAEGTSAICKGLLANCPSLKSVDIPDSVKSIDAYAFNGCASLESVRLPEGGCEIGNNGLDGNCGPIFTGCDSLKHIIIPDGLTIPNDNDSPTGAFAFAAPALESVTFANDVSAIDHGLLANCPSLKSVDIPDSVKSIGAFAFSGCEALESVRLPEGSCEIGSILNYYNESRLYGNVFQGCTSLTSLRLPKGITAISSENNYAWDYSMFSAPALKSITFEDGTNTLFAHMFENCEALESVSIPNGVKTIPSYCFSNCKALASLDIPESVKTIEDYAFKGAFVSSCG